ncbi:protein phosphatase 1 regulatory subunit 12B-like [Polymixia lowei]
MSSLLSHNKDPTRSRKPLTDSSAASPTATARSLRHERLSRLSSSGSSDVSKDRTPSQTDSYISRRESRLSARKKAEEEAGCNDYKKIYEDALTTNKRLKSKLEASKQDLVVVQNQLERVAQRKGRTAGCTSNVLETEKKERRVLEKKISDMEEELKVKTELKMENQRLKDENGALIRVISKLSK